jgi:hypothetical protein
MMSRIVARIERVAGVQGLASLLAERLEPSDLQSLMLALYRLRAQRRRPPEILSDYEANRFVRPSGLGPLRLLEWERTALSQLPASFDLMELSPVCLLGTSSVVASVSQDWSVSTSRNTEVVSDSTNVLALEGALRRRQLLRSDPRSQKPVHLAASHRLLRAQRYRDTSLVPHFRVFALCSAGRDLGNFRFELGALDLPYPLLPSFAEGLSWTISRSSSLRKRVRLGTRILGASSRVVRPYSSRVRERRVRRRPRAYERSWILHGSLFSHPRHDAFGSRTPTR